MPYLIATTDFSSTSTNAVHYGCDFALRYNLDVVVLHCYSLPLSFADVPLPSPVNEAELAAKEGMDALISLLKEKYPQLQIRSEVVYGDLVETISDFTVDNLMPALVVVGNAHSAENPAWMESTVLQTFRNLKLPVLAVPAESQMASIRKIGFAYDNKYEGSDIALLQLRELITVIGAELHVLYSTAGKTETDSQINEAARLLLEPAHPLYHVFNETSVDAGISRLLQEYSIDWLVLMPRKHGFLDGLFHKSQTKQAVNHAIVPILALHESQAV
ncbi:MAG: universal stress protein [Chitinophagia bacterium]|nr:universal stress protein [Chitinophagia bacterium]